MRPPIVLGSGLCASAVVSVARRARVFSPRGRRPHTRVYTPWRPAAVVANLGGGGLSQYYHGVTPSSVFKDETCQSGLRLLGLHDVQVPEGEWNFVPASVPRPWVRHVSPLEEFDLCLLADNSVYLCLSVIGNLQILVGAGYLEVAQVSDDIVFRLGTISKQEGESLLPPSQRGPQGVFHAILRVPGGQIGLRPRFFRDVELNFIDTTRNLLSIDPRDLSEKALRAVYLRYGIRPFEVKEWDVYVQRNFANAYTVSSAGVVESPELQASFRTAVDEEAQRMTQIGLSTFRRSLGDVMSGIHLGYDRSILTNLPPRLCVLDTSLHPEPGQHPTVRTFCLAYALAAIRSGS